jgi:hypothetical protein
MRRTLLLTLSFVASSCLLAARFADAEPATKSPDVQRINDQYSALRPNPNDLAIYKLDWTPSLAAAKEKAATEQRPILLIVVTNSYGNTYTGHC